MSFYKPLNPGEISQIVLPITKVLRLSRAGNPNEFEHFVSQIDNNALNHLWGIDRFLQSNFTVKNLKQQDVAGFIKVNENNQLYPDNIFQITPKGQLGLLRDEQGEIDSELRNYIIKISGLNSIEYVRMVNIIGNGLLFDEGLIKDTNSNIIGFFIKQINCIIWSGQKPQTNEIWLEYDFNIHQFKYLCMMQPNEFNLTNNITAYELIENENLAMWVLSNKFKTPFITTIGLYNQEDQLLAIAKLSKPIKKSQVFSTSIIIQMDYIP